MKPKLPVDPYDYCTEEIICSKCGGLDFIANYPNGGHFNHHVETIAGRCPAENVELRIPDLRAAKRAAEDRREHKRIADLPDYDTPATYLKEHGPTKKQID